jgi:fructose-1,6-bisphosphatase/inositol monophosphatase family enzyme
VVSSPVLNRKTSRSDSVCRQAILDVVRAARPDDAFLGEEGGLTGSGERTWLVDPLCGTLNFAARTPLVTVNVAPRQTSHVLCCQEAGCGWFQAVASL